MCVQLVGEGDIEGTQLLPWQQLHQGSVAALDICTETRQVLLMFGPLHIRAYMDIQISLRLPARPTPCVTLSLKHATVGQSIKRPYH